jgi:hypothetical protein
MPAAPDALDGYRSGRLGSAVRHPAFSAPSDPAHLLSVVADALNACERHGLVVDLEHGAVMSVRGYVLPVGDARLGHRWAVRQRLEPEGDEALNDKRATRP